MRGTRATVVGILVAVAGLGVLASGCSSTVSQAEVEKQVNKALKDSAGVEADKVSCPSDIDAKVGETMTCTITFMGEDTDVKVEITEMDGDTASFSVEEAS
jgi:hypothetical protein